MKFICGPFCHPTTKPLGDTVEFSQWAAAEQSDSRPELQTLTMDNPKCTAIRARLEFAARRHSETRASRRKGKLEVMAKHLGRHVKLKPFAIKYALDGCAVSASRRVEDPPVAGEVPKPQPPPTGLQGSDLAATTTSSSVPKAVAATPVGSLI
jgi:hypothetical protein